MRLQEGPMPEMGPNRGPAVRGTVYPLLMLRRFSDLTFREIDGLSNPQKGREFPSGRTVIHCGMLSMHCDTAQVNE